MNLRTGMKRFSQFLLICRPDSDECPRPSWMVTSSAFNPKSFLYRVPGVPEYKAKEFPGKISDPAFGKHFQVKFRVVKQNKKCYYLQVINPSKEVRAMLAWWK